MEEVEREPSRGGLGWGGVGLNAYKWDYFYVKRNLSRIKYACYARLVNNNDILTGFKDDGKRDATYFKGWKCITLSQWE